jgi:2-keto-3-deoxy-L-rhamnonate aldolase RhmA
VELAFHAGLDFLIIDGQHGAFDIGGLREALRAMQGTACFPIVRLPAHGLHLMEALLDAGFPAVMAPMVNTPEMARHLVEAAYYPPLGLRSQSSCRASLCDGPAYRETFNQAFTLLVMIEHIDAVRNIEEILAVPWVSGCFVGPTDLASSLQATTGEITLAEAIAQVRTVALARGKLLGIAAANIEKARQYQQQGFQFVAVSTDRRLLSTALAQLGDARSEKVV